MSRPKGIKFSSRKLWLSMGKTRAVELSGIIGASKQSFSNWNSEGRMPVKYMLKIIKALDLSDEEIKEIFK